MTKKTKKKKFYINNQYKRVQIFCACDREYDYANKVGLQSGDRCPSDISSSEEQCPICNYYYWIHKPKK
ncbi:MAG TPA: hypothetical protein VMW50_03475 [Dehalococcoidia bacterium]|nr:hypothetical protein [Dehalococcoidia bacterium]